MLTPSNGGSGAPLRVALLCSHRAPGLAHLLEQDDHRDELYEIVCALTSEPECKDHTALEAAGIPLLTHDIHEFYGARGARLDDLDVRREYDRATVAAVRPHRPNAVVLSSYLYLLTDPMLEAFPGRIVNVHDSDLRITGPDGRPRYRGLRSTRDAIFAGERETRATAHLVTAELDAGPILARSPAFPVHSLADAARGWGATDILKAYAFAHREWVIRAAFGPLLAKSLETVARLELGYLDAQAVVRGDLPAVELRGGAASGPPRRPAWSHRG